jgi:hypothetical protein
VLFTQAIRVLVLGGLSRYLSYDGDGVSSVQDCSPVEAEPMAVSLALWMRSPIPPVSFRHRSGCLAGDRKDLAELHAGVSPAVQAGNSSFSTKRKLAKEFGRDSY